MMIPPGLTREAERDERSPAGWSPRGDRNESQTVLRACDVLKAFQRLGEELSLAEVMERTGLPKTTAFRLLRTLIHGGLMERAGAGVYRNRFGPVRARRFRLGFAFKSGSEFALEVMRSVELAAAREDLDLITVDLITADPRLSARGALRNAERLIRERVDLVLELQSHERVAPGIASRLLEAGIPVLAMETPQPGATYFGANHYKSGLMAGKALGRWAKENWAGKADKLLLLELPGAGSLLEPRITGVVDGLCAELPAAANLPVARLNGRGDVEQVLETVRQFLRRTPVRRTLIGTVNDLCALAALRAFEEIGAGERCAVASQGALREARNELRRPGTRLVGTVAHFPERYGEEVIPLALALLQRRPVPQTVFVKHQLITPRNVDLIYAFDEKREAGPRLSARELRAG